MTAESKKISCEAIKGDGSKAGTVDLNPAVFGVKVLPDLVHGMVRWQRAKARAGTHDVLTRSEMVGGKKKPFKQKGTGRARAGSSVSPHWVGGAVVHGPVPRSYEFRLPHEMRRRAMTSVLSHKVAKGQLTVVEGLDVEKGKSKTARDLVSKWNKKGKLLIVVDSSVNLCKPDAKTDTGRAALGLRNIRNVSLIQACGLNPYDVLNSKQLLCTREALSEIEKRYTEKE